MARFNVNEADNYGGQGNGSFFSLKNNKDVASVRFLYNTLDEIEGFAVHEVEVDGKKRYVNCLREYNEPVENCPLCAARMKVVAKLFLCLYDIDADEVKIWDRGKTFFSKMSSLCARYNPLVSTVFEIERNGKAGDMKTTYETYQVETDDTMLEDLPEAPQILGGLVLDKSYEDMEYFLDNGEFPMTEEEEPQSRRNPAGDRKGGGNSRQPAGRSNDAAPAGRSTGRRTPASSAPAAQDETPPARPAGGRRGAARSNNNGGRNPF